MNRHVQKQGLARADGGVAPGPFRTDKAWKALVLDGLDGMDGRIPLGRYGEHEELANVAAFLVSDYAAYITGDMVVDRWWRVAR